MTSVIADFTFGFDGWVVLVFSLVVSPLGIWRTVRLWRGRAPELEVDTAPWFPFFGPAFWHGYRRCQPLYVAVCLLVFVPVGLYGAFGSPHDNVFLAVGLFGVFWGAVLSPLIFLVHVFAWPKWPIPPAHRHEPGAIVEWRDGIARWLHRRQRSS